MKDLAQSTSDKNKSAKQHSLAERTFVLLQGNWAIEREIRPKGSFQGTASFVLSEDNVLNYMEEGTLELADGRIMQGERSHTYILHEDRIEVKFADGPNSGEHFVDINFPSDPDANWPICSGDTHLCILDTYKSIFCFENEDEFHVTYTVCGPQKDYVSDSIYRRIKMVGAMAPNL